MYKHTKMSSTHLFRASPRFRQTTLFVGDRFISNQFANHLFYFLQALDYFLFRFSILLYYRHYLKPFDLVGPDLGSVVDHFVDQC